MVICRLSDLDRYTPEQAHRHDMRPGIIRWAQVNGRNLCLLSKKFGFDVYYIDILSYKTDLEIIIKIIRNVMHRADIYYGAGNMQEVEDLNFMERLKGKIMEFSYFYKRKRTNV